MEIIEFLKRKDKYEIADKFLTSYSLSIGGGSLNIWDGKSENFEHCSPVDGYDANIYLVSPEGRKTLYLIDHNWTPIEIENQYISYKRTYIKERKTIFDDLFVDILLLSNETDCKLNLVAEITPRITYENKNKSSGVFYDFEFKNNILSIYEKNTIHRDFYKLFSFNRQCKFEKQKDVFFLKFPIELKSSTYTEHINWEKIIFVATFCKDKKKGEEKLKTGLENPEKIFQERRKTFDDFFKNKVPYFFSNNSNLNKIYYFCNYVSWSNIYDFKQGNFKNPFTCPSKFRLLPQWFWDSAFHSIYEKYINTEISISSLRNIIENQTEQGHLPFTLAIDKVITGELIQPFILPIALWDIYLKNGNKKILEEFLPALIKFDKYLEKFRMEKGLVYLKIPGESGWDNSRRYIPEPPFIQSNSPMIKEKRYIFSPDFNTYIYLGRYLIKKMAKELKNNQIFKEYELREKILKKEIKNMWDNNLEIFVDKYIDGERIYVKTPGGMIPMLALIPNKNQSKKIISHLLNPKEFWTDFPIPTLSLDDPFFNPQDEYQGYWNGRVWPNINWLIIEALLRNNFLNIAKKLIERTINLSIATGQPNCYENYNPFTGIPYLTHNIFNYGWGGIFNDILVRRVCGIQCDGRNRIIYFAPFLYFESNIFEIKNLTCGNIPFTIEFEKKGEFIKFKLKGDEKLKFVSGKSEKIGKKIEGKIPYKLNKVYHFLDL